MGRRADHPLPPWLFDLKWDQAEGRYAVTREGITYLMDFHHYNDLKAFSRQYGESATVEQWYKGLDKEWRNQVKRLGAAEPEEKFYPDVEWED